MKDEYEYEYEDDDEDEVRTLKPHVELHESVIGFHEVSYKVSGVRKTKVGVCMKLHVIIGG